MLTLCAFLIAGAVPAGDPVWQIGSDRSGWSVSVDAEGARVGDGLRIGRAELWRDGWRPALGERLRRDADGSVALDGTRFTERWLDRDGAVEQRWELPRLPPGEGPLHVRVPLHGAEWIRDDERGVTLSAVENGRELTYGHGFLIDADGRRWDVPAAHRDGAIHLSVPARVLAEAKFPVVLDPTISTSQEMFAREPGPAWSRFVNTTFDGTDFTVIWDDGHGVTMWSRLDAAGDAQGAGKPIGYLPYKSGVASDGAQHLVVSVGGGGFLGVSGGGGDVKAVRFDSQGNPLHTSGIGLGSRLWAEDADVTWTGTHFNVAWANRIARVTPSGANLDPGGAPVPDARSSGPWKTVSANVGATSLVVTSDLHAFRRDDSTGTWLDTSPLVLGAGSQEPVAVATDGSGFFVVWRDATSMRGTRVTTAGVVQDPGGFVIGSGDLANAAAVAFDGSDFLVAWALKSPSHPTVRVTRVSPAGTVAPAPIVDHNVFPPGYEVTSFHLVRGTSGTLLVAGMTHIPFGGSTTFSAFVADNGIVGPWRMPALSPVASQWAAMTTPSGASLAWMEGRDTSADFYLARLDPNGLSLDGTGLAVARLYDFPEQRALALDGNTHVLVWSRPPVPPGTSHRLFLARVEATGTVLDDPPIEVHAGPLTAGSLRLACGNSQCLVVWSDGQPRATRIDANGAVLDPGGSSLPLAKVLAAGHDGTSFLLVGESHTGTLAAVAVDHSGGMNQADAGPLHEYVRMSCEPGRCLVVGQTQQYASARGFFIQTAGSGIGVGAAEGLESSYPTSLVWDGQSHLLVAHNKLVRLLDGRVASTPVTITGAPYWEPPLAIPLARGRYSLVTWEEVQVNAYSPAMAPRYFQRLVTFDEPMVRTTPLATDEDTALPFTLTGEDPQDDPITFTIVTPPAKGTLSGTPPNLIYTPNANVFGNDSFTVEASDGTHVSGAMAIGVKVNPVNDAPVAGDVTLTMTQGEPPLIYPLPASDVDGDQLTLTLPATPLQAAELHAFPGLKLGVSLKSGFRGTEAFTYEVSDGQLSDTGTFTLTVLNAPPIAGLTATPRQVAEGEPVGFDAQASDPGGDPLTFHWDFGDGASAEGEQVQHVFGHHGLWTVTLTVSDGLAQATATTQVEVTNVAPVITGLHADVVEEGTPVRVVADLEDPGAGDLFTFAWSLAGAAVEFTHDPVFEKVLPDDGTWQLQVSVSDTGGGVSATQTVNLRVRNVAPTPVPVEDLEVQLGDTADVQLTAFDPGGEADPLTWTLLEGPGSLGAQGRYLFSPTSGDGGEHLVRVQVADDDGGEAELSFTVRVVSGRQAAIGCACSATSSGGGGAGWLALLGLGALALGGRRRDLRGRGI